MREAIEVFHEHLLLNSALRNGKEGASRRAHRLQLEGIDEK